MNKNEFKKIKIQYESVENIAYEATKKRVEEKLYVSRFVNSYVQKSIWYNTKYQNAKSLKDDFIYDLSNYILDIMYMEPKTVMSLDEINAKYNNGKVAKDLLDSCVKVIRKTRPISSKTIRKYEAGGKISEVNRQALLKLLEN